MEHRNQPPGSVEACSGATTATVLSSSPLSAATTLVSITIGGNDVGFSVMETRVLESQCCVSAVNHAGP